VIPPSGRPRLLIVTEVADDRRLAGEYGAARARVRALLENIDEDAAQRRVPACPAWTVADLVAHLAGLAVGYGGGRGPEGDRQVWLEGLVTARRGAPVEALLEEWEGAGGPMEQAIGADPQRLWPLVYDVIAHDHDLRNALGRPGERDGEAITLGLRLGLRITARDLAQHDLPAVRVHCGGEALVAGDEPVGLTLEASTFESFRLLGSRRTLAEMREAAFTGDLERYLPGLVHMQLPVESLREVSAHD
jgi:uncharacterized protein (TIGR03083 family)